MDMILYQHGNDVATLDDYDLDNFSCCAYLLCDRCDGI